MTLINQNLISGLQNGVGGSNSFNKITAAEAEQLKKLGIESEGELERYQNAMAKMGAMSTGDRNRTLASVLKVLVNKFGLNNIDPQKLGNELGNIFNYINSKPNPTITDFMDALENLPNSILKSSNTETKSVEDNSNQPEIGETKLTVETVEEPQDTEAEKALSNWLENYLENDSKLDAEQFEILQTLLSEADITPDYL
jgi:hypothetical protein